MTVATRELVAELSQTVIAILVIIGGGLAILSNSPNVNVIVPFMAMVIGFYFGRQLKVGPGQDTTTTTTGAVGGDTVTTTKAQV